MTHTERFQNAAKITLQGTRCFRPSQLKLLQEFLRRELLWAKSLDIFTERPANEFYALAQSISPSTRYPKEAFAILEHLQLSEPERRCANEATRWYWLLDHCPEQILERDLPDPYEPLIWFLGRGGRFSIEHGIFDVPRVGGVKYDTFVRRMETGALYKPIVPLDIDTINQLDSAS